MMSLIRSIVPLRKGITQSVCHADGRAAGVALPCADARLARARVRSARLAGRRAAASRRARRTALARPLLSAPIKESAVMKCADIMSKNLEWLNEKDTVRQAAAMMADAGIGFLPICDKWKKVVGVVTDRDLTTRALARKIDPDKTTAALVMTSPAITLLETADVRDAEALMAKERKARLVITGA